MERRGSCGDRLLGTLLGPEGMSTPKVGGVTLSVKIVVGQSSHRTASVGSLDLVGVRGG